MGSRSNKRTERASSTIKVEQVFLEQDEEVLECGSNLEISRSSRASAEGKRKPGRAPKPRCNRSTQVSEDLLDVEPRIPRIPGENEPILAQEDTEAIVPQCRLCLRRVAQENLTLILNKHKAKVMMAFRMKIYVTDAYPFACRNCLNLLDIFLDFRQTAMKAKTLLLTKRAFLEGDGWDEPSLMETMANCKAAVEQNRKQLDSLYDMHSEEIKGKKVVSKNEDVIVEPTCAVSINTMAMVHEEPVEEISTHHLKSEMFDERSELVETTETEEDVQQFESNLGPDITNIKYENDDGDYEDNGDDSDYAPSVEDVKPSKRKASKRPVQSTSDESDENNDDIIEEDEFDPVKEEKPKRKNRKGRKKKIDFEGLTEEEKQKIIWDMKHQLCDFCGESVTSAAAEAHMNRHLGVKPYTCPIADCGQTFHSKNNQVSHIKRLHGEKETPTLECNICGQFIRGTIKVLNYHKKRHTQEKKHVCTVCGKGFTMKWYLRQHSIVHSGEFPHKCQYCGKRFNNKWSMKTHEKNIHEKKSNLPVEQFPTTSYSTSWEHSVQSDL
uniref:Zinc finger protein 16 n=1 Tax=Culex pipiens TaxID=7175 RepID=A0A8D8AKP2_CULPI